MIRLGQTGDGRLIVGGNQDFKHDIMRIEYYREQKLFNLVYDTPDDESDLMPCEITPEIAKIVEASPEVIIVCRGQNGQVDSAYQVPLIQIGV